MFTKCLVAVLAVSLALSACGDDDSKDWCDTGPKGDDPIDDLVIE